MSCRCESYISFILYWLGHEVSAGCIQVSEVQRSFPRWLSSKESACNAGDSVWIPGSGRYLGRRKWSRSVVSDSSRDPSVHGILQARILEWVAISFSRGSSLPRDWTQVSCIAGRCFNLWATRASYRTDILLSALYGLFCLISQDPPMRQTLLSAHFSDDETEAQRD